jgi:hypothetical protein
MEGLNGPTWALRIQNCVFLPDGVIQAGKIIQEKGNHHFPFFIKLSLFFP